MQQNMGLSDNLVVMASVIMSDVYSSNPMSPLPQILSMQPHNFPSPKTHNLFSYLFHSFNPKLWHARGAADSSCTSGEIHVIVGPMFDGKTTTLLRRIESESSNGRFVNLHQFYFLCVLYTCLKFMWVVDKILARFGGWCFFFFQPVLCGWCCLCQLSNMRSFRFSAELGSLTICMEMFPF